MSDELLWHVRDHVLPAALSLLPGRMDSTEARAMLLAVGLQESAFKHRRQVVRPGVPPPAMGLWQFEKNGGVVEVLTSADTRAFAALVCGTLLVDPAPAAVHAALALNDTLAACFARLLLYRDPRPMPPRHDSSQGWDIYLRRWRPGKPHPGPWPSRFAEAWQVAEGH